MTLPPWFKITAPIVVLALVVWGWNHEHKIRARLEQSAEAAQLAQKQVVAEETTKKQLQGTIDDLLRDNTALRAVVEEAKRSGASPINAAELSTAALPVAAPPPSLPAPKAPPAKDDGSPVHAEPPCALRAGDTLHVTVSEVTLRTAAGTSIVAGVVQVWRDTPTRYLLTEGRFDAALSHVSEVAPSTPPRWGLGLFGVCGASGCSAGPALAFPPVRVLGFEVDGSAAIGVGGLGAVIGATAVLRW